MNTKNQDLKEQEMVTKLDALVKEQNSKDHYVIVEDKGMYATLRGGAFDVHVDVQKTHLDEQDKLDILEAFVNQFFDVDQRGEVTFRQGDFLDICEDLNETTANYIRELAGK
jgi:replicative DNA helicase